jgi:hypothetical protein
MEEKGNTQLPVSIPSFFALRSGMAMTSMAAKENAYRYGRKLIPESYLNYIL